MLLSIGLVAVPISMLGIEDFMVTATPVASSATGSFRLHSLSNMLGSSKHSNIITNCIGGGSTSSFIDVVKFTDDVKPGDTYLLCTDGLSDMLPDSVISTLLATGSDANNLCDAAVAAGGYDNVTCCVMQF